jgi:hypothetical protein
MDMKMVENEEIFEYPGNIFLKLHDLNTFQSVWIFSPCNNDVVDL